jgi:hypothetical protein
MRMKLLGSAVGVLALAAAAPLLVAGAAYAHHSFAAEFDIDQPVTLEGDVVLFEFVNPHSWIHLDVTNPETGEVERWRVEGGAPSPLLRRGWTRNSLPAGTHIIVEGYRSRDGDTRANARDITFPDGRELAIGESSGLGAPSRE